MKNVNIYFANTNLIIDIDKAEDGTEFIKSVNHIGEQFATDITDILLELSADMDKLLQTALQTPPKP